MNKYIRKCLLVYISMTIILCGMVGITYAITSTDADQYVTRSQYATDMQALQLELDEAEAGLLGKINRYRTTDIKFVTFDTPDKQYVPTNNFYTGRHMGGNYFPRQKVGTTSGSMYTWGIYDNMYYRGQNNHRTPLELHRLWNGNYFISPALGYKESISNDSATEYNAKVMCALPLEDLPGWYLVLGAHHQQYYYIGWDIALVKLDPKVPMPDSSQAADITRAWHTVRLKKDLWDYCGDNTTKLTTTESTQSCTYNIYTNMSWMGPLIPSSITSVTSSTTQTVTWKGVVDESTGDFILKFQQMYPVCPSNGGRVYRYSGANSMIGRFIPKDNVEYLMSSPGSSLIYAENGGNSILGVPEAQYIGTGQADDPAWEYEFVDCVNGIKYWHAMRKSSPTSLGTKYALTHRIHYSLPIVY